MVANSHSKQNDKNKVIILNKPFLGGWLNNKGNIAHEIIDFLRTDKGDYFVYNNPWGVCPDEIGVANDESDIGSKGKYFAKYLVLTSNNKCSDNSTKDTKKYEFKILYVIELAEKMHNLHTVKKDENDANFNEQSLAPLDDEKYKQITEIIRKNEINYNGKPLNEIYGNDGTLYFTFRANKIYKAETPILVNNLEYNFQRNKGYIYQDKFEHDYQNLISIIEENIQSNKLAELKEIPALEESKLHSFHKYEKTFMSLIGSEYDEQLYTNMLFNILKHENLMTKFINKFSQSVIVDNSVFEVSKEKHVQRGRIDICAENEKFRVVIENKILSGLNGIRDEITQLSTYFEWAKSNGKTPICFVVAPNFRVAEIKQEIMKNDQEMVDIYKVLTYGDIATFLENEKCILKNGNFEFHNLVDQIINSFKNFSYDTVEKLYAQMFIEATK